VRNLLTQTLKAQDRRMWIGFIWLRTGCGDVGGEPSSYIKCRKFLEY
jgi:hypothetical protein